MKGRMKGAILGIALSGAMLLNTGSVLPTSIKNMVSNDVVAEAVSAGTSLSDMPSSYTTAMEWIWNNRCVAEGSTTRWNTIFDQIIAGDGTLNFVVRWQSYRTVTYEQRQQFETMAQACMDEWTQWLSGYDEWPYDHVEVNVVGWAVLDKDCLLDLHDDEVVYTDTEAYDSSGDTSNGTETIPTLLPDAPAELWRFNHFTESDYVYPGTRFDMYLWATQGFPSIGGCGGDWGQRLSDTAYLSLLDGSNKHVLVHEFGHGFGITDFYGGEGESNGYPPGGFPGNGTSIMMAGSSAEITDFDGWMLRYIWSQIKDDSGRFDLTAATTTAPAVTTTTTTTTEPAAVTTTTEAVSTDTDKWTVDVQSADSITMTFSGTPYATANGVVGYWDGAWETIDWSGDFDANGNLTTTVDLPSGLSEVQIQKYYAAVWNNNTSAMEDISIDLVDYTLNYNTTTTTTTTITTTQATETETTTTTTAEVEKAQILVGDIVPDMEINSIDYVVAKNNLLQSASLSNAVKAASDMNGDGEFSVADLLCMQKYLIGISTSFPAGAIAEYIPE